jgi:hypothetical protein
MQFEKDIYEYLKTRQVYLKDIAAEQEQSKWKQQKSIY